MRWPKKVSNLPSKGGDATRLAPLVVTSFEAAQRRDSVLRMTRLAFPLALLLPTLAGCGSSDPAGDIAPKTQDEAEALEDAASMLDEQRLPEAEPSAETPSEGEGQ